MCLSIEIICFTPNLALFKINSDAYICQDGGNVHSDGSNSDLKIYFT